jgi:hypothetical protein
MGLRDIMVIVPRVRTFGDNSHAAVVRARIDTDRIRPAVLRQVIGEAIEWWRLKSPDARKYLQSTNGDVFVNDLPDILGHPEFRLQLWRTGVYDLRIELHTVAAVAWDYDDNLATGLGQEDF